MFRVAANEPEWAWLVRLSGSPVKVSALTDFEAELLVGLRDRFLVAEAGGVMELTPMGSGFVLAAPSAGVDGLRVWSEFREPFDADPTSIGRDRGSLPEFP